MDSQWNEQNEATVDGTCDHCDEEKPVQYLPDPFLDEVYDRISKSKWCLPCWIDRKEEV